MKLRLDTLSAADVGRKGSGKRNCSFTMKTLILCLVLGFVSGTPYKALAKRIALSKDIDPQITKIVGGKNAAPCELKYQISVQDISFGFPFHFCGGSIVAENWVLTAAHCFDNVDTSKPDFLQVVAGEHNLVELEGKEQTIIVSEIIIHERYDKWSVANDIALLKLSKPIEFDDCSHPIALPNKGHLATGNCVVSGWGATIDEGHPSDVLQEATVPMMPDDMCKEVFGPEEIDDCMICAGLIEGGIDACEGDSGGPLVCTDTEQPYLAGVVSWGYGCGRPGFPGVYSEISCYIDWIHEHIFPGNE